MTLHPRSVRALLFGAIPWGIAGAVALSAATFGIAAFASPPAHPSGDDNALLQAHGSADVEHNVFEGVRPDQTLVDAQGHLTFDWNHVYFDEKPWPSAKEKYKSTSNHELIADADSLASRIRSYGKSLMLNKPIDIKAMDRANDYYQKNFGKDALEISSEIILRAGPRDWRDTPGSFQMGARVVKENMTIGPMPFFTSAYFLHVIAHSIPDNGAAR